MKTIVVVVRTQDPPRVAEALRAAVGLTLRGDRVRVVVDPVPDHRGVGTLRMLGHTVTDALDLTDADAVEVWS